MRLQILPLVLVTALGATSAAYASETTTGMIKSFDMKARTLTLEDGTIYMLPGAFKDPGLKVGEKVSVLWDKNSNAGSSNETRDVLSVTVVR
jgi:Cu/Ag efflux protein CusF